MGEYDISDYGYYIHPKEGKVHYESNDEIWWEHLGNPALPVLLKEILKNQKWKELMFSKYIPEDLAKEIMDDNVWAAMLIYGCPPEYMYDLFADYIQPVEWLMISTNPHTPEFLDKHSKNIVFIHLAMAQHHRLPEWFIEKYLDKLDWKELVQYQNLSTPFIVKHIMDIPQECWPLIWEK